MRFLRIISLFLLLPLLSYGQTTIVKNGKSSSSIIVQHDAEGVNVAAELMQRFVREITGVQLPLKTNMKPRKNDIVISVNDDSAIAYDGFRVSTSDGMLHITGNKGLGALYGVVTVLEKYWGVDYWGENEYSLKETNHLFLPELDFVDNPSFKYRQTQFYGISTDPVYKIWNRLSTPDEYFAANHWVHTFDKLLPSSVYGETNPEFYAYYNGKRNPGKAGQWCLTNPELFEIVVNRIDSIFKANPDKTMISVSQNDGNYTNCACPSCKAIDDYEGAFSGSLITFVNKLADRFPDKEISTLAYLYTMKPPKHVKPRSNVNIMLCSIDADREVSLTENASGIEFVDALEGWSAISDNIFIWDYGINFDNYLSPFPNLGILQDNMQLFKNNGATMHFSQIAGSRGGDFAELRAYLVSKLLWNTDADVNALIKHFLSGYYGGADSYIYQYIKLMEGALLGSGERLWIYDSPVTFKYGMLKPELMKRYNKLFDKAEDAVKEDDVLLARVQRLRLPMQYSELEIARTNSESSAEELLSKLSLFEERVKEFKVPTLNERTNSPLEYCELYKKRYLPSENKSIAHGAKIEYLVEPSGKYKDMPSSTLTDGLYGGTTFVESWIGWEGKDASFVVDLGENKDFTTIETDFLHQVGAWILFPLEVEYSYSVDGENYVHLETHSLEEEQSTKVMFKGVKSISDKPLNARYIKVDIVATKVCPHWHYGVGYPSWLFIDEVSVY